MTDNPIIWQPKASRRERSAMHRFMSRHKAADYRQLHRWSIERPEAFWPAVAGFCGLEFTRPPERVLRQPGDMTTASWFDGGELNFAAHLLSGEADRTAIVFCGENGARRELSLNEVKQAVSGVAAALVREGVRRGDRVAGFLPNCPEAVIAMLATSSIGAIWSSCSPDFGVSGVVDRFGQIEPMVLFCADGYCYNGKRLHSLRVVAGVLERIGSIARTVVVPFRDENPDLSSIPRAVSWEDFAVPETAPGFAPLPFAHPLYIMYSSGTTGVPKCIVHGAGGTLIQHLKEHQLHSDIGPGDRVFYFTTCGWMMWNWLVSALASGATLILYDGAPFFEDGRILWRIAEREGITVFGTSAKYLSALEKAGVRPKDEFELPSLRTILSTGSPLAPASFDFVYDAIAGDVQLSSITGGTDIISCFALGNPLLPVRRGEIQCPGLGMAVEIYDDDARSVVGESGELVCTKAFPSMPVSFWNDPGHAKYHAAYFERFPGVWAHGDYAEITDSHGIIMHG
ncbi:MAG TPA: acetoacetate--CoA ligase, partial [Woeseiaceae bacterium]|nr:acetoacetate--CoA ligase [Woeseiaceae bacterium]